MSNDPHQLAALVKQKARAVGFDLVGICSAEPSKHSTFVRQWLDDGRAGAMHYLHERFDERTNPASFLSGARSVICVAMNYHVPLNKPEHNAPVKVARYALGVDYHEHVKPRLYDIADWLRETVPGAATKCGVDTVPLLERELAARAGIGWVGKNTCVIHPFQGSWFLLAEIVTTVDLAADEPMRDRCGTCTRCIDACPTGAIDKPYQIDAKRCISYLTIENPNPIEPDLADKFSGWVYGCDICQEVCPYNRAPPVAVLEELQPKLPSGTFDGQRVLDWSQEDYWQATRRTAMRRVKLPQFKRNAQLALRTGS
ncbi:MAG: tRNA epoxyqueuosine(34) reductase QueG [Tepidisphaeraceae bacterium]